jgi:hypothetical protein
MGQVLHGSATTTAAVRRAIQHSQESLRALASRYGSQSEDRRQVEEAELGGRSADRSERTKVDGPLDRGGGDHRRLQAPYAIAARRLPLRASADDPPSDPFVVAPLSAAAWDRAAAGYRGRQGAKEEVQVLSDRLLPH